MTDRFPSKEVPVSFRNSSRKATSILVVVTLLWGLSFPLMKNWQDASKQCPGGEWVASMTLVALRMFFALVLLAIFQPRLFAAASRREFRIGLLLGLLNSLGFGLQVVGLAWTSPALSAFITSLASAWVPLLMLALFRLPIHRLTLMGLLLGIAGATVLGIDTSKEMALGIGEALTLLSTVFFALMIVLLDRLGRNVKSAHFTVAFLIGTGLPAILVAWLLVAARADSALWLTWTTEMLQNQWILKDLALLTVLCTVLTFHWFNVYQPQVTATRAALIYLLEPVFASMFSIIWGHDSFTARLIMGGTLILGGNLLVELPGLLIRRNTMLGKTSTSSEAEVV
jgi:drug/metabolite transporter (DMT)-like permease